MIVQAGKNNSLQAKEGEWYKVYGNDESGFIIRVNGILYFLYNDEIADYSFLDDPD